MDGEKKHGSDIDKLENLTANNEVFYQQAGRHGGAVVSAVASQEGAPGFDSLSGLEHALSLSVGLLLVLASSHRLFGWWEEARLAVCICVSCLSLLQPVD